MAFHSPRAGQGKGKSIPDGGGASMKKLAVFGAMAIMVCLSGCGAFYNVQVNGYTEPGTVRQMAPGGSFCVIENKEAKNPLLEQEVKDKIQKLLAAQGYAVAPFEQADYYLFFAYGMGEPRSVIIGIPDYAGGCGWGMSFVTPGSGCYLMVPPLVTYVPYTTLYDRWLLINVVEGPPYRTRKVSQPLWVGEARSTGASSDLRTVLNYLLVADFREFGKNTGKAVTVEIKDNDPAVAALSR
jgi:hypothetical protein